MRRKKDLESYKLARASGSQDKRKAYLEEFFTNHRIKTTLARAKEIRGDVEHVITWANRGDVDSRLLAIAKLGNKDLVGDIFTKAERGMFNERPGNHTRIKRLGQRRSDSALIVILELKEELSGKTAISSTGDKKPIKTSSFQDRTSNTGTHSRTTLQIGPIGEWTEQEYLKLLYEINELYNELLILEEAISQDSIEILYDQKAQRNLIEKNPLQITRSNIQEQ